MTLPLPSGTVVTFSSECLWPAVVLVILAVIIAPAIWSNRGDRQRAAMAVIMIVLDAITTITVATRRSLGTWRNSVRRAHYPEPGHHNCRPVPALSANRPPYSEDPTGSHRTWKIRAHQDLEGEFENDLDQRRILNYVNRRDRRSRHGDRHSPESPQCRVPVNGASSSIRLAISVSLIREVGRRRPR